MKTCEFGITKSSKGAPSLSLTVDLRAKVIRKRSLLDHIYKGDNPNSKKLDKRAIAEAKRNYGSEIVICTYDKRCYSVVDLDFEHSPASLPVPGQNMSHAEYFKTRKNRPLKYPDVRPIIAVLGRNNKKIYLPAEYVCINELEPFVKQQLPLIASFKPNVRHEGIEEMRRYLTPGGQKTKGVGGGLLPALGIILKDERVKVGVEVLALPTMMAAGMSIPKSSKNWDPIIKKADYKVDRGIVNMNVVVVFHKSLNQSKDIYDIITKMVNNHKSPYRFPPRPMVVQAGDNNEHWGAVERHFSSTKQTKNVFVLDFSKPPRRQALDPAYSAVKYILTKHGYLSQFVNFNTCDHGNAPEKKSIPILQGVARQILGKCGVRVWWVSIPKEIPMPAIFIGVDVFHAPRKYKAEAGKRVSTKKSVAAIVVQVVRSHNEKDNRNADVYSETFERDAGQEMDLGQSMCQTVTNALKYLKVNPMSCIVWRDGVGTPAVKTVASQEIPAVRKALTLASTTVGVASAKVPKQIPLSYIVVQKRISTKFLTADGKFGLPAGSLITGIQGIEHQTFYINGTSPPNSTAKPARFIIANVDKGFVAESKSMKLMADVSWALCNNYSNWPGPIKLPSPVQYAHKLAELAGGFDDYGESINAEAFAGKIHFL